MSDSAAFRIDSDETPAGAGLWALFSGVDGLARAAGVVALGAFLLGAAITLLVSAA